MPQSKPLDFFLQLNQYQAKPTIARKNAAIKQIRIMTTTESEPPKRLSLLAADAPEPTDPEDGEGGCRGSGELEGDGKTGGGMGCVENTPEGVIEDEALSLLVIV